MPSVTLGEASERISRNLVFKVPDGPDVTFEELWRDKKCVIVFLRRFGWSFCRLAAKEISALQPIFRRYDVRLVGVGLEHYGLDDFVEGNFFDGGILYCDCWLQIMPWYEKIILCQQIYTSTLARSLTRTSGSCAMDTSHSRQAYFLERYWKMGGR